MRIALIHNWPGERNSELELIKRIIGIFESRGHQCVIIDPLGHLLSSSGKHQTKLGLIDLRECDFCLNLHYANPNIFDTFSYVVNWNPLDYVVRHTIDYSDLPREHILYRTTCLQSHSAVLSAGSEEMDDLIRALNIAQKTCILSDDLYLHTTSHTIEGLDFSDYKKFSVFFIGANWEYQQKKSRHGNLIELLDKTNLVDFYGVRKQKGASSWDGVKNYKGELPFDGGKSILEKSNACGATLVLHSEPHRNSGLASTRIFQACAAKTLAICDDNQFIIDNFGDSVLYFKYTGDSNEDVRNIKKQIEWIGENPTEAREKAEKAYAIFQEKFALESEIDHLLENHHAIVTRYRDELCAKDQSVCVDVIFLYWGDQEEILLRFLDDLEAQKYVNTRAIIYAKQEEHHNIKELIRDRNQVIELVNMPLYYMRKRYLYGHVVVHALKHYIKNPYFSFYSSRTSWQRSHLSQLVRAQENTGGNISNSSTVLRDNSFEVKLKDCYMILWKVINNYPKPITLSNIGGFAASNFTASSMLFRTEAFVSSSYLMALRFFDAGWAFFCVICNYLHTGAVPSFVPKFTDYILCNKERISKIDIYQEARQTQSFERDLCFTIFKFDPKYHSAVTLNQIAENFDQNSGLPNNTAHFSINEYVQKILINRPILLNLFRFFFRIGRSLLRLS